MARKRTTRREKHAGHYYFDKTTKQHQWTIKYEGKRYRVKDADETQARLRFEQLRTWLLKGANVQGSKALLFDYLPAYITTELAGRVRQSTVDDALKRADIYILPTLGKYAIGEIKRDMIVRWVNAMMNEPDENGRYWSRTSIKQALGLLRRALEAAVPEHLEHNPTASVKVPMRRKGDEYKIGTKQIEPKIFTAEQMQAFLDEVQKHDHLHGLYVYYVLVAEIGARRGEGLGLRRCDIDFEGKAVTIEQQVTRNPVTNQTAITIPKTDAGIRQIPVSDETIALLREQCLRVGAWARPTALVFPGKDGNERQPGSVSQHFRRVCTRLGFQGYTLHSLRKYAITDWRTAGADLEVAAAMAGHKGVRVTAETYSIPTMERKRDALNRKKKQG